MFWVGWFIWFNERENDTLHHILNRLLGRTPFSIQSKDIRNLACKAFDFSCYGICSPSISMNLLNKFWRVRETFLKWKSSQNICYLQSFEQPHVRWHLCRALKQLQSVCLLHGPKWWQVRVLKKKGLWLEGHHHETPNINSYHTNASIFSSGYFHIRKCILQYNF